MNMHSDSNYDASNKPSDCTWHDHLLMLLHIGAELEHSLMVQYLYAAYSLGGSQVPKKERAKVQHWRSQILTVAREEMGHLMCIQNLLCLLGGPITLDRSDYPWDSPFYPFRFSLQPLSIETLGCYVYAEMEPEMEDASYWAAGTRRGRQFAEDLPRIIEAANRAAGSSGKPQHVGKIYEPILAILSDPKKIPDSVFNISSYAAQASWEEWGKGYRPTPNDQDAASESPQHRTYVMVHQMASRTEAVKALQMVAGQGEAPHLRGRLKDEPSHFDRFVDVYQEFEQIKGWSPTRNCPENPVTMDPGSNPRQTYIENEHSRTWAQLFNLRYRMLLTYLGHSYHLQRTTDPDVPNVRGGTLHRTFGEMYNIKALSDILFRLPLTDDPADSRRAGPPFRLPYTLALPDNERDCWNLHRDLHVASTALTTTLLEKATGENRRYLTALAGLDQQAIAWIDTMQLTRSGRQL